MLPSGIQQLCCKLSYERLLSSHVDNALDEPDTRRVAQHLSNCVYCSAERERLTLSKRALLKFEIPTPRGQWPTESLGLTVPQRSNSLFKQFFTLRIAVPAPVAAGLLIAFLGITLLAFQHHDGTAASVGTTPSSQANDVVKIVAVPVERVITRTVYVNRKPAKRQGSQTVSDPGGNLVKRAPNAADWPTNQLDAFRPAASANLRVIKEQEK